MQLEVILLNLESTMFLPGIVQVARGNLIEPIRPVRSNVILTFQI